MKIAIFEPHPSFGGGSERVVLDISRQLATRDHDLFLMHDTPGTMVPAYSDFIKARRHMPLRAFGWRTLSQTLLRARRVADCWREWRVDVVFSSDVHYLRFLALAGCLARLPVVLHLGLPNALACKSQRFAMRRFVAAGVAPSVHTAKTWSQVGWPVDRLHVVPNGVDTTRFRPADDRRALRRRLGLPEKRPIVVYVGRLVREKGILTLFQAFYRLRATQRDALLLLVGISRCGSVEPWPAEARRCGLPDDAVCFAGCQTSPEDYLAAADVAVVPSEWDEPFGLVVLEAMACGTPPIVSDRGIMPELVGPDQAHLVFPSGQAAVLAERMALWISDDRGWHEGTPRLVERARDFYSSSAMTEAYEQILLSSCKLRDENSGKPFQLIYGYRL
jgi:glycosyltransferase involved in cell wall biosynthesis